MTHEHRAVPSSEANRYSEASLYQSLAAIRAAHSALRRSISGSTNRPSPTGRKQLIRSFLTGARRAGAFIADAQERRVAQSILDLWSAELAASSQAPLDEFESVLLAPFDATQKREESDEAAAANNKDDQHALIRLSAMARQWRASGKQAGYLLTGDTIEEAARFKDRDANLDMFIKASEGARERRKRNIAYSVLTALAVLGSLTTVFISQFYALPQTSKSWIRTIKVTTSSETQIQRLWWLELSQPWSPPYDLSGTEKLANIHYPKLELKAPNFSTVEFTNVNLSKAQLPFASFAGSSINIARDNPQSRSAKWYEFRSWSSTGNVGLDRSNPWNEFSSARLKFSQYRDAKISTTSFAGADLYRAVFDRALLCDVNFTNADLQKASFWGATLDDRTYGWLRKTAWWVAVGWNSRDFEKLLNAQSESERDLRTQSGGHSPASTAQAQAIRLALRTSERFRREIEKPIADATPGTFERALALNDMAWTLTTWGIEGDRSQQAPTSCNAKADANDPLDAAREAICIIEDLKRQGSRDKDYDYWLSTFRDTQAYILMQTDRMSEARALYERDMERTEKDGGMLFRYAITLFAVGNEREAGEKFDAAIKGMNYLPSDELQNLKRHIPLSVRRMAYDAIDMAYPTPKPVRNCPPG
ncbi:hypothetical protein ACVMII_005400 [Bradyrhizobium diazoefficiens]